MDTIADSYILDYTEYIREQFAEWVKIRTGAIPSGGVYVFNGGIINVEKEYYIISARCIISKYSDFLLHSEIATMWGIGFKRIIPTADSSAADWNNKFDSTMICLVRISNFNQPPVFLSSDILDTPDRGEDPRLYRRADGNIYLGVVTSKRPCDLGIETEQCFYTSEYPVTISYTKENMIDKYEIKISREQRRKVCLSYLQENKMIYTKNISNWVYNNRDYVTDFKPDYSVFLQPNPEVCHKLQTGKNPFYKFIKSCYNIKLNNYENGNLRTIQLIDFAGTTPSIEITPGIKSKYFGQIENKIYCGVAHVRIKIKEFVEDKNLYKSIISFLSQRKGTLNKNLVSMLKYNYERYTNSNINLHPDAYLMMLYFFNPEPDRKQNIGTITHVSHIFYPIPVAVGSGLPSGFMLAFPTGLMMENENIIISYGEGDVKERILVTNLDKIGLTLAKDYNNISLSGITIPLINKQFEPTTQQASSTLTFI